MRKNPAIETRQNSAIAGYFKNQISLLKYFDFKNSFLSLIKLLAFSRYRASVLFSHNKVCHRQLQQSSRLLEEWA